MGTPAKTCAAVDNFSVESVPKSDISGSLTSFVTERSLIMAPKSACLPIEDGEARNGFWLYVSL